MYDLHCHYLPGIDDGPQILEEALELAALAVANGITHSVVTPHIHLGRYENDKASIDAVFSCFQQALQQNNIPLLLAYAGEVRLDIDILQLVSNNQIPFIGQLNAKNILLLEFPHSHIPPGAEKFIDWLMQKDILPMIAHPERNKDVMRNINKLDTFINKGCLLQLTAGSVTGYFGERAEKISKELLDSGNVTIIATDAHNKKNRPPILKEGLSAAKKVIGNKAYALVMDNPREITQGLFRD